MEFLLDRDCTTAETHSWRFPRFAAKYGLFSLLPAATKALPVASSWRSIRFKNPEVQLYLQRQSSPANFMIIREGLAEGGIRVLDMAGRPLYACDLVDTSELFEAAALSLPETVDVCRVALSGAGVIGWQIHYDEAAAVTVHDPQTKLVPFLLNRAYGLLQPGASKVKIVFEAAGEGFHSAVLYDPDGAPVQAIRHFVDFQDPGRYQVNLEAAVSGPRKTWSLEIHDLKVVQAEGLLPYWSCTPQELFNPERAHREDSQTDHE